MASYVVGEPRVLRESGEGDDETDRTKEQLLRKAAKVMMGLIEQRLLADGGRVWRTLLADGGRWWLSQRGRKGHEGGCYILLLIL